MTCSPPPGPPSRRRAARFWGNKGRGGRVFSLPPPPPPPRAGGGPWVVGLGNNPPYSLGFLSSFLFSWSLSPSPPRRPRRASPCPPRGARRRVVRSEHRAHLAARHGQLARAAARAGALRLHRAAPHRQPRHSRRERLGDQPVQVVGHRREARAVRHVARLAARRVAHRPRRARACARSRARCSRGARARTASR